MAEYPEFSPKVEEILRKAKAIDEAKWMIDALRWMVKKAEECEAISLINATAYAVEFNKRIEARLDMAVAEDIISWSEMTLAERELSRLEGKYMGDAIRKFEERCICRPREE